MIIIIINNARDLSTNPSESEDLIMCLRLEAEPEAGILVHVNN